MFTALESEIITWWHELSGDARQKLQQALDDAKGEAAHIEASVTTRVSQLQPELDLVLKAADPVLAAAARAAAAALEADIRAVFAGS